MSLHPWVAPRPLHPGAWWLWALGLATAAGRTTNPLLLLLIVTVAGYVVAARRTTAPWARAYGAFLKLALTVLAIRVVFHVLLGATTTGTVLFTLPALDLPDWAAGVRLGGAVTAEALAAAAYEGLRLATVLVCVGAANALANPKRLLRCLPGALYEVSVAVVVAMSLAPQLLADVQRVRAARRLRGRPDRGVRGLRGVAMPVLEGALERSLELAAAMDSRGYGRSAQLPRRVRRTTAGLTVGGLLGVAAGVYGLLDAGSPPLLGLPLLGGGALLAGAGLALGGRRAVRTRYRPDPWAAPEWLVSASGVTAAVGVVLTAALGVEGLDPSTSPLRWPPLPVLPTLGLLAALAPAVLAPRQQPTRASIGAPAPEADPAKVGAGR